MTGCDNVKDLEVKSKKWLDLYPQATHFFPGTHEIETRFHGSSLITMIMTSMDYEAVSPGDKLAYIKRLQHLATLLEQFAMDYVIMVDSKDSLGGS